MDGEDNIKSTQLLILTCISILGASGCAFLFKPEFQQFEPISIQTPHVQTIAAFAVNAHEKTMRTQGQASRLTLAKIISAGQQNTAETKYRLHLSVKIDGFVRGIRTRREKTSGTAEAIIWQKLTGELILISWTWIS
jgi:hypothetical protein